MGSLAVLRQISRCKTLIRVTQQGEPATFNQNVRIPGNTFLLRLRRAPRREEWSQNSYWKSCITDLQAAYQDICAYTACWLPDSASVDHFVPKSAPAGRMLAYEWSNYRLASQKVNSRKGNLSVLDPFTVPDSWFVIDFASSMVRPSRSESVQTQALVNRTIDILGLNDRTWIRVRFTVLRQYSTQKVSFEYLKESYPFIARELERQGRKQSILGSIA